MVITQVSNIGTKVGQCIYCGATSSHLTKEHAIPYGLNGPWTLLEASCQTCADITHRFERDTMKGLYQNVRTILRMQSRRLKERSLSWPLVLESQGLKQIVHVPLNEFPLYLPMPRFPPPGILVGSPLSIPISAEINFTHIAGPTFEEVSRRYGGCFVGGHLTFYPQLFAQTIAKIAYCAAVYTLGVTPFKCSPIRQVILGEDPCIGYWVGSWTGDPVNEAKGLHAMQVRIEDSNVHVILRLFAQFNAPEYHIVLRPTAGYFIQPDKFLSR